MACSLLAAVMLVSCSSDGGGTDETPQAISFHSDYSTTQVSNSRAGGEGLEKYMQSFHLYGYKTVGGALQQVMDNYTLNWLDGTAGTTSSNSDGWEYVGQGTGPQTIKYWDHSASEYRFVAYKPQPASTSAYPYTQTVSVDEANKKITLTMTGLQYMTLQWDTESSTEAVAEYSLADGTEVSEKELPFFARLWCKAPQTTAPVQLVFTRPLAHVRALVLRSETTDPVKITDVSFRPADATAKLPTREDFTVTYPLDGTEESWTSTASDYTLDGMSFPDGANLPASGTQYALVPEYIMIPNSGNGDFVFSATYGFETHTASVPAQYMQWKPGVQYTYVFKITETNLIFVDLVQAAVKKWNPLPAIDHEVYNW